MKAHPTGRGAGISVGLRQGREQQLEHLNETPQSQVNLSQNDKSHQENTEENYRDLKLREGCLKQDAKIINHKNN